MSQRGNVMPSPCIRTPTLSHTRRLISRVFIACALLAGLAAQAQAQNDPPIIVDVFFFGAFTDHSENDEGLAFDFEVDVQNDKFIFTDGLILGGDDGDKFNGMVTTLGLFGSHRVNVFFNNAPDFEAPASAADSNIYELTLSVRDSGGAESEPFNLTVTVTNVNEEGTISAITGTPQVGETLTAGTVETDPDAVTETNLNGAVSVTPTYQWESAPDGTTAADRAWADISGATSETYAPVVDDVTRIIRVVASYTGVPGYAAHTATSAPTDAVQPQLAFSAGPALTSDNPLNSGYAKHGDTLELTFTVNQALASTPEVTVTIAGQSVTATKGEGDKSNEYTATYTVDAADVIDGVVSYAIAEMAAVGNPGNTLALADTPSTIQIDITAPTTNLGTIDVVGVIGTAQDHEITFSEEVTGVDSTDFTATGATTVDNVTGADGTYTITFTPKEADFTLTLAANGVMDRAGNMGPATPASASGTAVDATAPTVAAFDNITAIGVIGAEQTHDITFSEEVTGLAVEDFSASTGATVNGVTDSGDGDGATYTIAFTPNAADFTLSLAVNSVMDLADTPNTGPEAPASASGTAVDTTAPTVTLGPITAGVIGAEQTHDITFSEAVTGLAEEDFSESAEATVTGVTGTGATYTITFTPNAADFTLTLAANSVTDLADIPNPGPATPASASGAATEPASTDATLSGLTIADGGSDVALMPVFAANNLPYTADVANGVTSVTVTPTVTDAPTILGDPSATVAVNDAPVVSGEPSGPIALDLGNNTITIIVTAEDGVEEKTYTVILARAVPPPSIDLRIDTGRSDSDRITRNRSFVVTLHADFDNGRDSWEWSQNSGNTPYATGSNTDRGFSLGVAQRTYGNDVVGARQTVNGVTSEFAGLAEFSHDSVPPTINLNGSSVTIPAGVAYKIGDGDPATTTDVFDGANVNDDFIEVTSSPEFDFDNPAMGMYTLTYNVMDRAGNPAQAVNRIVTVEAAANTPPTADAGDDDTGVTGTPVTLDGSRSSDPDPDGTIASYAWEHTLTDGNPPAPETKITLAETADPTFTPTETGTYTFELTVTDDDDATATDTVVITVQDALAFEVNPELASDNTFNSNYARHGDTLTLTFTVNQALASTPEVTVTIAGQDADVSRSGESYTATYTVDAVDVADGVVSYAIAEMAAVGNPGNTLALADTPSTIRIDATAPDVEFGAIDAGVIGAAQDHEITFSEEVTGVDSSDFTATGATTVDDVTGTGDTYTITFTPGEANFTLTLTAGRANDIAGNSASSESASGTATEAPSTDATLITLTISQGALNPTFASGTDAYAVSVGNGVASVTVTPTVTDTGTATVTVGKSGETPVAVASGQASGAIALTVGDNIISIEVTAEDGTSEQTYTLTVTRADNTAPTINTGNEAPRYAENADVTIVLVATYTATDTESNAIAWSISGGTDASFLHD